MSILEILEEHRFRPSALAVGQCMCDLSKTMRVSVHRAHQAQVLEQHMREREVVAWNKCARNIVYEDGTPVEIKSITNPYRSQS